jgi:hypothetical protein
MFTLIQRFIVLCLGALGLLLQLIQTVALWSRNKWVVVVSVFLILGGGFFVFTTWGKQGVYLFFGALMVLLLIGSGLYKISVAGLEKVKAKKEKIRAKYT